MILTGGIKRLFLAAACARAPRRNPDNILARSYKGRGHVDHGEFDLARTELTEIRARGDRQTWAEAALRLAIERGRGVSY